MSDKQAWVCALRTVRAWRKLYGTAYPQQVALQCGMLDLYTELVILSRSLNRSIPQWVKESI